MPPGQVAEPDIVDVDGVEVGQHVDEMVARRHAEGRIELPALLRAIEHLAVDELHDIERRAVHRLVRAQAERLGDRNGRRTEGGDDAVLTPHVVRRRQHVAERRAADDDPPAVGTGHRVREVRAATTDQLRRERSDDAIDVRLQPRANLRDVKAVDHGR